MAETRPNQRLCPITNESQSWMKDCLCQSVLIIVRCWWRISAKPNHWNHDESIFMYAFAILIDQIINLYIWTLLAYLAAGWLIAFKIINPWQPIVRMIIDVLARIHEPLLRPVRRILPDFGALDVSPIVLFLLAQFLRNLLQSSITG